MATVTQPISEDQALLRLILLVGVILLGFWYYNAHHHPSTTSSVATPSANQTDLKVEPATGSSTETTNPQSAASPVDNSPSSIQSGQSDLQQAQNNSQLPQSLKQELGL